ncbi:MAG TPA: hypothetical protein VI636_17790 [Candidatus Angelobacter sp.]
MVTAIFVHSVHYVHSVHFGLIEHVADLARFLKNTSSSGTTLLSRGKES